MLPELKFRPSLSVLVLEPTAADTACVAGTKVPALIERLNYLQEGNNPSSVAGTKVPALIERW